METTKAPYNWVISSLTQPEVANQQKNILGMLTKWRKRRPFRKHLWCTRTCFRSRDCDGQSVENCTNKNDLQHSSTAGIRIQNTWIPETFKWQTYTKCYRFQMVYSQGSNTECSKTEYIRKPNVIKVCFRTVEPFENRTFDHSKTELFCQPRLFYEKKITKWSRLAAFKNRTRWRPFCSVLEW